MQKNEFLALLAESVVVAAVKDDDGLVQCLNSNCKVIFLLHGNVLTVGRKVAALKQAGKTVLVHADLIGGLSLRDAAVDFLSKSTETDGILSSKFHMVRHAKSLGLLTVQRFFLLDSLTLRNIEKQLIPDAADVVEILPGVMPKIVRRLSLTLQKPIIAGGLISDSEDMMAALAAGAVAVSSINQAVWTL